VALPVHVPSLTIDRISERQSTAHPSSPRSKPTRSIASTAREFGLVERNFQVHVPSFRDRSLTSRSISSNWRLASSPRSELPRSIAEDTRLAEAALLQLPVHVPIPRSIATRARGVRAFQSTFRAPAIDRNSRAEHFQSTFRAPAIDRKSGRFSLVHHRNLPVHVPGSHDRSPLAGAPRITRTRLSRTGKNSEDREPATNHRARSLNFVRLLPELY
jgi:hypothetical protein